MTRVTVRKMSADRIALIPPDPRSPVRTHTTVRFDRHWHVVVDGRTRDGLFVAQSADGRMYGVKGSEILIVTGPQFASRVAYALVERAGSC